MKESVENNNLQIHPIFEPVQKFFGFYILAAGFVGQFDFQKLFLEAHPSLKGLVDDYNRTVNLKRDGRSVKSETGPYWIYLGRLMAISLFNILEFSEYNNILNHKDIYKFTKHIRNGAAHNNRFLIHPSLKRPIRWRNKIIDNSLNKTEVFTKFINPGLLMLLMTDLSKLIYRIEDEDKNQDHGQEFE